MAIDMPKLGRWNAKALLASFRPALPASLGAVALTFLFAAVMPMAWVRSIAWNLYLDRLSSLFTLPIGEGGRLALALGLALFAGLLAMLVALALTKPAVQGNRSMNRRVAARAKSQADGDDALPRRRADRHPDDAPRAPIRADRDLPAEGLGPVRIIADDSPPSATEDSDDMFELSLDTIATDDVDMLMLDELAPVEPEHGDEATPIAAMVEFPDEEDMSLGAMVARFEDGLARRRAEREAARPSSPLSIAANEDGEPEVDFALEAALSTLQRMSLRAVG